ncbi:MAG TPA: tRNA (adenosine(37)-N6)-threonylcarbamoyltransferase complex dimerization subunit type 1 TsaB [Patescibacteria group bacterium]|nr:tRNA (adenosine(37)-N6)-threonylcarbamoyltransferase complex dimerization subunit type 1 TsaB [Patescibacteria group bacterium]
MLSLAMDTSTSSGSLAVLRNDRVLGVVGASAEETYSSRLFRHLRILLEELQLGLDRFDLFSVASGPGSFTGLRIGLAAAKGWAEVFSKPAIGVSVLEAVAAQATAPALLIASLVDARRGQVYGAIYERRDLVLVRRGEEMVLTPGEFFDLLAEATRGKSLALVSPTPEAIEEPLEHSAFRNLPVERVSPFLAPVIGRLGYLRAASGEAGDPDGLEANYVRRSDAEMKWKD